jgi:hypothetical protein
MGECLPWAEASAVQCSLGSPALAGKWRRRAKSIRPFAAALLRYVNRSMIGAGEAVDSDVNAIA